MISTSYLVIISVFLLYYLSILFFEKKMIHDPKDIIGKFLSVLLLYAGISIIYFSFTGNSLFGESTETYDLYIFIIGFVAVLWTIPDLLSEFRFFRKFIKKNNKNKKKD